MRVVHKNEIMKKPEIRQGATYSNGDFGSHWAVRQVLSLSPATGGTGWEVTFKVLVGPGRRGRFSCTHEEFVRWVRYEVVRNENSWERVLIDGHGANKT